MTSQFQNGKQFIVSLGLLMLAACTNLGPDYQEPEVSWLDSWETDMYGRITTPEAPVDTRIQQWWLIFDDPILNVLIEIANDNNPSLQIAGLRILEGRARLVS